MPDANVVADPEIPIMVQPLSAQPLLSIESGNTLSSPSQFYASMTINSHTSRSPSIYMTAVHSSQPPLISLHLLSQSFSCEEESKQLVKIQREEG